MTTAWNQLRSHENIPSKVSINRKVIMTLTENLSLRITNRTSKVSINRKVIMTFQSAFQFHLFLLFLPQKYQSTERWLWLAFQLRKHLQKQFRPQKYQSTERWLWLCHNAHRLDRFLSSSKVSINRKVIMTYIRLSTHRPPPGFSSKVSINRKVIMTSFSLSILAFLVAYLKSINQPKGDYDGSDTVAVFVIPIGCLKSINQPKGDYDSRPPRRRRPVPCLPQKYQSTERWLWLADWDFELCELREESSKVSINRKVIMTFNCRFAIMRFNFEPQKYQSTERWLWLWQGKRAFSDKHFSSKVSINRKVIMTARAIARARARAIASLKSINQPKGDYDLVK